MVDDLRGDLLAQVRCYDAAGDVALTRTARADRRSMVAPLDDSVGGRTTTAPSPQPSSRRHWGVPAPRPQRRKGIRARTLLIAAQWATAEMT